MLAKKGNVGEISQHWCVGATCCRHVANMLPTCRQHSQLRRLRQVRTADWDASVILYHFVMITLRMMRQQDMADRPGWFVLWSPCIVPWINMVSVQICRIFLHLSKIAYISCNVCTVTFIACDKYNVAYIAYIAYIACKKETLCLRLSEFLKNTPVKRNGTESLPVVFLHNNCE